MASTRPQRDRNLLAMRLLVTVILLSLPWFGLTRVEVTAEAIRSSAYNAVALLVLAPIITGVNFVIVAVVARLIGDRVMWSQIGIGPTIFKRRIGSRMQLVVSAIPSLSTTAIVSRREHFQNLRITVCFLVGAVVIALPSIANWYTGSLDTSLTVLTQRFAPEVLAMKVSAWYAGAQAYVGLAILMNVGDAEDARNRQRRSLFWLTEVTPHLESHAYAQAAAVARRGLEELPDDQILQLLLVVARSGEGHDDAFALAAQLKDQELPAPLKALALNSWAWHCYMRRETAHAIDAEKASMDALELGSGAAEHLDTRGHVLLWLGRAAEAETCLRRAHDMATHESTRASSAAGLAMVYAATNRPDEAAMWLARAREHGCEQRLLARAIAAVDPLHRN